MPLLQKILETQSMHSFYQKLLQDSIKQQKQQDKSALLRNPPPSLKIVLSIQTLNELAKMKSVPYQPQQKVYLTTQDLLQPGVMDMYKKKGLVYIRRRFLSFRESLRNPTVGTHIELLKYQEPSSYPIDSVQARKLLLRLCF